MYSALHYQPADFAAWIWST